MAEEAFDDLTDGIAESLGVSDWWDDEPTAAEAELARFQCIGRVVSPIVAAAATSATLHYASPFGGAPVNMVAAAISGAFMYERNLHQILVENWLYIRIAIVRAIPAALRTVAWLLWNVVLPLRKLLFRGLAVLGAVKRLVKERIVGPLYDALTWLAPPLEEVLTEEALGAQLAALPSLGKKLASKLLGALLGLMRRLTPRSVRGFALELLDKAERYFLPYGFAWLGVALQMRWVRLSDFPRLLPLLLNPTAMLVAAFKPPITAALARLRGVLPAFATAWLKA